MPAASNMLQESGWYTGRTSSLGDEVLFLLPQHLDEVAVGRFCRCLNMDRYIDEEREKRDAGEA